ncbi:RluA family pseudouridine synthase [Fervidobacterium thailandense]|uniref:Pseudouridine synthase n=1 Tax=Fervidobacterium thailandense TaxID=1008305 RepID=A0A1E3G253_9BACT|nr:RluA family pseudouridine synthase [Fervidobacterium thailandense]ODN30337.1 RNA pseudouridine synthase [Fervidobacterium thailandense]
MVELLVTSRENGWRLDKFVLEKAPDWVSRTFIQKAIKNGEILVNGTSKKPSYRVKTGDTITLNLPEKPQMPEVLPENIPLDIIYEDRDILVINKQPGIITHPIPSHTSGTIVNAVLYHCKDLQGIGGVLRPGIVHRLDKDTSGVMVIAKNDLAHQSLTKQFKDRLTEKLYVCLVKGVPEKSEGVIEISIARNPVLRVKMTATNSPLGKPAVTYYRVVRRFGNIASLVFAYPKTGRTHQIRVHMKYIGHPLMGDEVYGRAKEDEIYGIKRQMLHALMLAFYHPRTGEKMKFIARIPEDFKNAIVNLNSVANLRASL